ncbi:siderophore ABC transporter substrate-binding protein [Luteimonas sp. JM171]|uniref:siderophore ABC transporter substrate-binding protein n=1 Tax=Luteimonas sp. JM171 TaxID=1896164 RepID=UPI00085587F7|nr:ABC transporter substrate-binding protein [Luteimonas sp. JM171]AOH36156.1 hypothetical protein BGP89_07125 [Luteimonas sp. JM171]
MKPIHLIASALLALSGALQAAPIEVTHAQGVTVVPEAPQRTVVFDLATLDNLQALGVEQVAGIPDARLPAHLQSFGEGEVARVGTLFEPDLEAVRALEPELIVIAGRSASSFQALSEIAPTIDLTASTDGFLADITRNLETLGRIYGREAQAAARLAELEQGRQAVAEAAGDAKGLVLFTVNGNVIPHAPGARFGIVHDALGLPSVLPAQAPETGPRPERGSPEAEAARKRQAEALAAGLAAEPEWLLVLDRGLATGGTDASDLSTHPGVSASQAFQAGRVLKLDPPGWYLATGGFSVIRHTQQQLLERLGK